ncbi:hypothetical protein GIB67_022280 [Kingdonia uniflora]|uniref:starch synthase n=1 Tax=Kingdonia uniflora TaxID=39325 RepID=A0A7J7KW00_9MAGN|nr:hypothetical protein GIB67_022280 [Kingdonia uniflora]
MATKLPAFFLSNVWHETSSTRLRPRLLSTSCKMRAKNLSSQSKRQHAKKSSPERLPINENFQLNNGKISEAKSGTTDFISSSHQESSDDESTEVKIHPVGNILSSNQEDKSNDETDIVDSISSSHQEPYEIEGTSGADLNGSSTHVGETENVADGDQLSNFRLDDLIGMIRNAEKNILLLNQARLRALGDLDKIQKEALQKEIKILEMRLAETDAKIKVVAEEKIHVEILENQLEKLKNELSERGDTEGNYFGISEEFLSHNNGISSFSEELSRLRNENLHLKGDLKELKEGHGNIKQTDERVLALENERSSMEAALNHLESRLELAQEDLTNLSTLKSECKDLWEKVGKLQELLDKATKQADQAIAVLQQNHELRKRVDKLEESLEESNSYKLSSDKMKKYNDLMLQKISILEERLERSDEEIHFHVQLYQESVKEFQDVLVSLKEESKRREVDGPVDDMPWEFWSHLLLTIDGWLLEKKLSLDDTYLLREMTRKRDRRICDAYLASKDKTESEVIAAFLRLISSPTSSGLHIIHIAAEMAPVAKVGGLGDVVSGLSKALQKKGHLVEIILPKYDCMEYDRIGDLKVLDAVVESYFDGHLFKNKIWVGTVEGLPVYFIEPQHPAKFFWRGQFYGEQDDFKRFSFFSRAALELILQAGKNPDIIHCHDWQTAFVVGKHDSYNLRLAPLYWDLYAPKGLNSARVCFTCHNFEYQGTASASELGSCGLDVHQLNRPDRMQDNSGHGRINPVKGAVVFSNIVTTVSPTYAQEVRTPEGGKGLQATLNSHSKKFVGILNGIDTDSWDPSTDNVLEVQYSADDIQGKAENKEALRKQLKLSNGDPMQPLVGCITRLVPQKGVHLIRHAIYRTLELGGQFVLLGSSPVDHIQREFEGIAKKFQSHPDIRLILKYDEVLSHTIYAASDMFIIPSIFEPCGLTQLIAMRYGSIPIVRKTGGLNDSVFDLDDDTIPQQFRNGFTFLSPNEQGLNGALERAFDHYTGDNESWKQLVQRNMKIDFSWDSSAAQYVELYEKSVSRAKATKRT